MKPFVLIPKSVVICQFKLQVANFFLLHDKEQISQLINNISLKRMTLIARTHFSHFQRK